VVTNLNNNMYGKRSLHVICSSVMAGDKALSATALAAAKQWLIGLASTLDHGR
jgi:hypothetical protein